MKKRRKVSMMNKSKSLKINFLRLTTVNLTNEVLARSDRWGKWVFPRATSFCFEGTRINFNDKYFKFSKLCYIFFSNTWFMNSTRLLIFLIQYSSPLQVRNCSDVPFSDSKDNRYQIIEYNPSRSRLLTGKILNLCEHQI